MRHPSTIKRKSLRPDFIFSAEQRRGLERTLSRITANPYADMAHFRHEVRSVITDGHVPEYLTALCENVRRRDPVRHPFFYVKNAPNDVERPVFDFTDPVKSKRALKRTFVAELFLELMGALLDSETITYRNDNDGDFFHDVYPMEALKDSQSQKSLVSLGFHSDSANHFARPGWINMLCMRNPRANTVFNTYVVNKEAVDLLDDSTREALRLPEFYTPYDDLTQFGDGADALGDTEQHPILNDDYRLVYFENRTVAFSEKGRAAVDELNRALHEVKYCHILEPDDFINIDNNLSLHGREIEEVRDSAAHKTRWMVKSYTVGSLGKYEHLFVEGRYGVVNG